MLGSYSFVSNLHSQEIDKAHTAGTGFFHDTFPIQAVWASGAFIAMGGGTRILYAVTNSVIADVCPQNKRSVMILTSLGECWGGSPS